MGVYHAATPRHQVLTFELGKESRRWSVMGSGCPLSVVSIPWVMVYENKSSDIAKELGLGWQKQG